MGMTIDEHKEHLIAIMDSMPDDTCGDWRDSLAFAVDTMRKYKQIEEIVEDRNGKPPLTTLNEIVMVVEEWTYYKKKARENRDTQFVPVTITDTQGNKRTAYLYKPQNLVCTNCATVEFLEGMGCKIEEVHNENSKN